MNVLRPMLQGHSKGSRRSCDPARRPADDCDLAARRDGRAGDLGRVPAGVSSPGAMSPRAAGIRAAGTGRDACGPGRPGRQRPGRTRPGSGNAGLSGSRPEGGERTVDRECGPSDGCR